ncbi:hypothetical protein [Bacillus sp. FJAT-28004]|nr:hypothetical protein [Bacillus sp. FJAT-28004]
MDCVSRKEINDNNCAIDVAIGALAGLQSTEKGGLVCSVNETAAQLDH